MAANLRLGHQRTRGAGLHTLSAGHARAVAHVVVQVEDDLAVGSAQGVADDVVDLLLTAGAHAAVALDACIKIHGDGRMRNVRFELLTTQGFKPGPHGNVEACSPVAEFTVLARTIFDAVGIIPFVADIRHIRQQHLDHHILALDGTLAVGINFHTGGDSSAATGR